MPGQRHLFPIPPGPALRPRVAAAGIAAAAMLAAAAGCGNVGANGQGRTRKEALDDLREAVLASSEADGGIPEWLVRSDLLAVGVDEVA